MSTNLKVRLVGSPSDGGDVIFNDFREFCDGLSACLAATERAIAPEGKKLKYKIVDLEFASASLTLEAIRPDKGRDKRKRVIAAFEQTVAAIQKGKKLDGRLGQHAIETFRKLAAPLGRRAVQIWVGTTQVTPVFSANIDRLLGASLPSEGAVTGRVDRVNVHGRQEFVLYPPIGDHSVICEFDDGLLPKVRRSIRRTVTVNGRLVFREDAAYPYRAVVKDLEIHPDNSELPTLASLRGISPGCTGDQSSVEFVRALRDA